MCEVTLDKAAMVRIWVHMHRYNNLRPKDLFIKELLNKFQKHSLSRHQFSPYFSKHVYYFLSVFRVEHETCSCTCNHSGIHCLCVTAVWGEVPRPCCHFWCSHAGIRPHSHVFYSQSSVCEWTSSPAILCSCQLLSMIISQ